MKPPKMQAMRHGGMKAAPKAAPMPKVNAKPRVEAGLKNAGLKPQAMTPVVTGRGSFKIKG